MARRAGIHLHSVPAAVSHALEPLSEVTNVPMGEIGSVKHWCKDHHSGFGGNCLESEDRHLTNVDVQSLRNDFVSL